MNTPKTNGQNETGWEKPKLLEKEVPTIIPKNPKPERRIPVRSMDALIFFFCFGMFKQMRRRQMPFKIATNRNTALQPKRVLIN